MPDIKRKVVAITFMAFGAVFVAKDAYGIAAGFYGFSIIYWVATGWWERRAPRRRPSNPTRPVTVEVTAGTGRTDGARGAYSRLDPVWQDWLRNEAIKK